MKEKGEKMAAKMPHQHQHKGTLSAHVPTCTGAKASGGSPCATHGVAAGKIGKKEERKGWEGREKKGKARNGS